MSKQHAAAPQGDENEEEAYIGNIWGKKFTLYGGLLILFMTGIMFCEHQRTGTKGGFEKQEHAVDKVFEKDSIQ